MREQRRRTHERLEAVTEEQMVTPTTWGGRTATARFGFYRLIAHEVEHTVHLAKTMQALGIAQSEARLILKNLQAARGELEGMLVGLTPEDLDRVPAEGEWSVREVVEHILKTEESYSRKIKEVLQTAPAAG
jgi:hypothetical protein